MIIGALQVRLLVRESRSLKDKRQIVRSILDRLRGQFNIAASEVDHRDDHRQITLGIAAVGDDPAAIRGLLQTIQEALRKHPIAEYLGGEIDIGRDIV
jgi:uncharacterized protein YlxP (DUF503 family)